MNFLGFKNLTNKNEKLRFDEEKYKNKNLQDGQKIHIKFF